MKILCFGLFRPLRLGYMGALYELISKTSALLLITGADLLKLVSWCDWLHIPLFCMEIELVEKDRSSLRFQIETSKRRIGFRK